jgi:hypothetical protein
VRKSLLIRIEFQLQKWDSLMPKWCPI